MWIVPDACVMEGVDGDRLVVVLWVVHLCPEADGGRCGAVGMA